MEDVYAAVLAGGSGTRFWPASRSRQPKQLLPLSPDGGVLIVEALRRLAPFISEERTFISTSEQLVAQTQQALPGLPATAFLAEPEPKNTAPCVGWVAEVIGRRTPESVVIVVPSDQHIQDVPGYQAMLRRAIDSARNGKITTLGIYPTRPETGYGYIKAGRETADGVREVAAFVEKPNQLRAEEYVAAGNYYWNAGIFIFRAQDMLNAMQDHMPALHDLLMQVRVGAQIGQAEEQRAVARLFTEAAPISIDYGIAEKTQLNVVPADVGWSDLGSFQVAWELASKDADGNLAPTGSVIIDSQNNLVMDFRPSSEKSERQTVALVGVQDMCVVLTTDAMLVVPRERCQDVKEVVSLLKQQGRTYLT